MEHLNILLFFLTHMQYEIMYLWFICLSACVCTSYVCQQPKSNMSQLVNMLQMCSGF